MWIERALQACLKDKALHEGQPFAFVWNFDEIRDVVSDLQRAFPSTTLHAFAAKANPVKGMLCYLKDLGMGCESASLGEFTQALRVFEPSKVVFDSPCKSLRDLDVALRTSALINLDNFQELDRVKGYRISLGNDFKAKIGLRVNPQTGAGALSVFSTATKTSKFGIPLSEKAEILAACRECSWITALHVHTGSQGCGLDLLVAGIRALVDLALEVPHKQITTINIGGGLPVNFSSDEYTPSFAQYASRLREAIPELFTDRFFLVTEFGRAVVAKAGVILTRVEYTKNVGGRHIASQHAGVDVALRTVWAPKDWPLRIDCYSSEGKHKKEGHNVVQTDVAGPCCLGGDLLAQDRALPKVDPGDYFAVRDVGAYYHSSYSYYNLRQSPPLYSWNDDDTPKQHLHLLLSASTVEQTVAFMSGL